jgi:hypothetical protein
MKKLVFASTMALASIGLALAPTLPAQQQEQPKSLSIQNPAEYNDYEMFSTQQNPKAKADAGEDFLKKYPQSIAKQTVLQQTMEAYEQTGSMDGALSAATRLLQVDPNNLEAIYVSVTIKKAQCAKTSDAQTCDDAAALAQKGLQLTKPAAMAEDEWQKLTAGAFPVFHSAIAVDDVVSKKDFKGAQDAYTDELKPMSDEQSKSALQDTLQLAQAYSQPGSAQNLPEACWLYARVWDFAPQAYKTQIEPQLEYYYKKYHGKLDGLDQLKQQAQASTFPAAGWTLAPAPSPQETIHNLLQTTDPKTLALADKETVLAMGAKPDADAMWAVLQGQQTQVPGTVLEANATSAKISVTVLGHPKAEEFTDPLKSPMACGALPTGEEAAAGKDFITNSVTPDDKLSDLLDKEGSRIRRISIVGLVPTVKMAVTQDAKAAKVPDFIVNMKDPASCKDIPAVGSDFVSNPGAAELVGTYSTYRQVPATSTTSQAAEIVLSDGQVIPAEPAKKPTPVHRAVRRPAH